VEITAGIRKLSGLAKDLENGSGIVAGVMPAAMDAARRYASQHPTPQSRIAASAGLVARGDTLQVSGPLAGGSEYGSSIYRQFGPRRGTPAWFARVTVGEDRGILAAGDKALESVMDKAL
jgi:hypothetical protein